MIIARVEGGLGNQLFIYAAARALALRTGAQLKLDIWNASYQEGNRYGSRYQLDQFGIEGEVAERAEVASYMRNSRAFYWRRKRDRHLPFALRGIVEERALFQRQLLTFRPRRQIYLLGYWQREEYFRDEAAKIRRELKPRQAASRQSLEIAQRMRQEESAFVHVRRIDYEHRLSVEYYATALKMLSERVNHHSLFVFGDDLEWAKRELPLPDNAQFIEHNGDARNYEDLWLMTQCRHAIIANSSFSWWGAWLNDAPNRTIISPGAWGYRAAPASGWLTVSPDRCGIESQQPKPIPRPPQTNLE
jgi:hypothetical protein